MNNLAATSYDELYPPPTNLFSVTKMQDFKRDTKYATWLLCSFDEQGLNDFWVRGIHAKHAAYSIQAVCVNDVPEEDYDGASYVVLFTWTSSTRCPQTK